MPSAGCSHEYWFPCRRGRRQTDRDSLQRWGMAQISANRNGAPRSAVSMCTRHGKFSSPTVGGWSESTHVRPRRFSSGSGGLGTPQSGTLNRTSYRPRETLLSGSASQGSPISRVRWRRRPTRSHRTSAGGSLHTPLRLARHLRRVRNGSHPQTHHRNGPGLNPTPAVRIPAVIRL